MDAPPPQPLFHVAPHPLISRRNKLNTPPRPKRLPTHWKPLRPVKHLQNRKPLQVAREIDLPPSPKRKLPRVSQKPKQKCITPVKRLKLLSSLTSSPSAQSGSLTPLNIPSIDNDEASVRDGMGDCGPLGTGSASEDEFNFEEAVSQIEACQASQLPAYRELLLWNPESYARLTNRCYIIQDWNPRHSVLQVLRALYSRPC